MPYHNQVNADTEIKNEKEQMSIDVIYRMLWVLIPVLIGGVVSIFSNFDLEIQIIMWGVLAVVAIFGMWAHNSKVLRRRREAIDKLHWENLMDGLDEKFDTIDVHFGQMNDRFDKMDERFDQIDNSNATMLRNELVSAHREWVEQKGYITLEALEYIDKTYEAYHGSGHNGSGTRLWQDIHELPIRENR